MLSPILFNIYVHDLIDVVDNTVSLIGYADDFCIYAEARSLENSIEALQNPIHNISGWMHTHGLEISEPKTSVSVFSRHNINILDEHIKIDNFNFKFSPSVKYLGLTLDQKLSFKTQIQKIISKCEASINILRLLNHKSWDADPEMSLLFYRTKIRSIID